MDYFAFHDRLRILQRDVDVDLTFNFESLNRLLRSGPQFFVVRPLIHNRRIAVSDIRDVRRLIDNRDVTLGRNHRLFGAFCAELVGCDKTILFGSDVIIAVGPITNAGSAIEMCLGR